ncbi:D-galactose/ D-glucose-binding protein [Serratia marcescens]|uniref:D-galactose/ D-glucose-binding protein n=1 Tax=Serratia marcescens TaxID=615 RepID=A0A379ZYF3_SERMA|nr:D-galactose/ D-glucose-binding protein [Serratia marcescens]
MKLKKLIAASVLMCMLPASVLAKDIKIGVSMAYFDDNFLTILRQSMQSKMKADGNVSGQFEDAKGDIAQQIQQIENFVSQGVDAIILNPVDTQGVKPMIKLAENAKIPLVFVNRKPEVALPAGMAYVGSDSKLAGKLQMEALAKLMNGKGNVMILMGELSSEATRDRTRGVEEVAANYPGIKIVDQANRQVLPQRGGGRHHRLDFVRPADRRHRLQQRRNGHRRYFGAEASQKTRRAGGRR